MRLTMSIKLNFVAIQEHLFIFMLRKKLALQEWLKKFQILTLKKKQELYPMTKRLMHILSMFMIRRQILNSMLLYMIIRFIKNYLLSDGTNHSGVCLLSNHFADFSRIICTVLQHG